MDLYYNDYAGLVRGGHPTAHKDHYEKTIKYLTANKAPTSRQLTALGFKDTLGHWALLTPRSVYSRNSTAGTSLGSKFRLPNLT